MNERAEKDLSAEKRSITATLPTCLAAGALWLSATLPVAAQPPEMSARAAMQARLSQNVDFSDKVVTPADFFEPLSHALKMPVVFPLEIDNAEQPASESAMPIKKPMSAGGALKTLIPESYGVAVVGGVLTSLPIDKLAAFSEPLMYEATRLSGLKFINSLNDEQVKTMYAAGALETTQLLPEQTQLLMEFVESAGLHKWGPLAQKFPDEAWPPTPEQWRAYALKFNLAYTQSFTFIRPNGQETGNVDLWDLGRGWVRELPTTQATPLKKQAAILGVPQWQGAAQLTPRLQAPVAASSLTVEKTRTWSARELGAEMQRLSGHEQAWSKNAKLEKTHFLLTDGTYPLPSLERIIALYAGDGAKAGADKEAGKIKESDDLFLLGETAQRLKQVRRDRVNAVAAQSKAKLQRLPALVGIFRNDAFEKRQSMAFGEMTPLQQALIRDSATNSGWVAMEKLEIEKCRVVLFESILFRSYDDHGSSGYGIW